MKNNFMPQKALLPSLLSAGVMSFIFIQMEISRSNTFTRDKPLKKLTPTRLSYLTLDGLKLLPVRSAMPPFGTKDQEGINMSLALNSPNISKPSIKTLYPVTVNAPYLMENPILCSSVPDLAILAIVHTAPSYFYRRNSIRATWTNESYFGHLGRMRVLFLLGRVKDPKLQQDLEKEFKEHGDLLQGDFIDAYRNLSHKGVMAYKWVSERCKNAKLILKVDDDICVNTYTMLTKYLPRYQNQTKKIFCNYVRPRTMRIMRNTANKWFVHEDQFKGYELYPRYCSGYMVVFTNDFMSALYRAASITPFFWVDDVYLYGLVPGKIKGVKYDTFPENVADILGHPVSMDCYMNGTRQCNYLAINVRFDSNMEPVWKYMTENYIKKLKEDTTKREHENKNHTERSTNASII